MGIKRKGAAAVVLGVMLAGVGAQAAHAEGSFNSFLTQVQPGFESRTWTDRNLDATSTSIYLGGCKVNYGGQPPGSTALTSVGIALVRNGSIVGYKSQKCGTYSFGDRSAGTYSFVISDINGVPATGTRIFLNASTVTVRY